MKKYRIAFLISHPIQYFSPLFKKINQDKELDLTVYYCSSESIKEFYDKGFSKKIEWGIPLLEGYKYKFLKNYSLKPSIFSGFFGLINFGIIKELDRKKFDAVIIHGWNYFTHILAIIFSKIRKIKVMLRGDNPYIHEVKKNFFKKLLKRILLGKFIFKFVDVFLYIGKDNRDFYRYYGVPENKLVFMPYSVENERFIKEYESKRRIKKSLREKFGFPVDDVIILFVGKLIERKRPFDLIKSYERISFPSKALVIVGDGDLKNEIENYVKIKKLKNVFLTGFKNQAELPEYYLIADIFVLPSEREPWGLVVNEAMCFSLPCIVSDMCGCAKDLIKNGENGFIFKQGDVEELTFYLDKLIKDKVLREKMGKKSFEIISNYTYENGIKGIKKALKI